MVRNKCMCEGNKVLDSVSSLGVNKVNVCYKINLEKEHWLFIFFTINILPTKLYLDLDRRRRRFAFLGLNIFQV